jgi:hypothetical protein
MSVRRSSIEEAQLEPDETAFDLAFACRVGVLDGRHPRRQADAIAALRRMLVPGGRIFVDTGTPLRQLT